MHTFGVQVPVPRPVQQGAGVVAAVHWAFDVWALAPLQSASALTFASTLSESPTSKMSSLMASFSLAFDSQVHRKSRSAVPGAFSVERRCPNCLRRLELQIGSES